MNKQIWFAAAVLLAAVVFGAVVVSHNAYADPSGENTYCGIGNVANFGAADASATLPQTCYYTDTSATQSTGTVINVSSSASLVAALSAAHCGDTLRLATNTVFSSFTVPSKGCDASHYITIRTSAPDSALPPAGTRITPCYAGIASLPGRPSYPCSSPANVMAKISMSNVNTPAIAFANGAANYRIIGLELTRNASTGVVANLVKVNGANHIIFDRTWVHGTATDTTTVGINLDTSNYIAVVDSYLNDFHCTSTAQGCVEAKAIGGGSSNIVAEGTWKIVNNFIEGSAEDVGFGIANTSSTFAPGDIEIRHNYLFKPTTWMPGDPSYNGLSFIVRDHLEFKNATRVLIEGNVFQNAWAGYGLQQGSAIILTPRIAGAATACASCSVTNITMRYNSGSHLPQAIAITPPGNTTEKYSSGYNNYSFHDDVFDDLNYAGCSKCGGVYTNLMYDGPDNNLPPSIDVLHDVTINHITQVTSANATGFLTLGGMTAAHPPQQSNIAITNSIFQAGTRGVASSSASSSANCAAVASSAPKAMFDSCWNPYTFLKNAVVGGGALSFPNLTWPSSTFLPSSTAVIQFVNLNGGIGGDYHLASTSPYKAAGTDGLDLGANIDFVNTYTSGTTAGSW